MQSLTKRLFFYFYLFFLKDDSFKKKEIKFINMEIRYINEQSLLMGQYVVPAKWNIKKELNDTLIEVKRQK